MNLQERPAGDGRPAIDAAGTGTEAAWLQEQMIALIRAFGLLRPEETPCGQPLSVSEAHALLELSRPAAPSQAELGDCLRLEKSTVSRLVTQLEARGWVERGRDAVDGRVVRLRLTERGRQTAARVNAARVNRYAELLARIAPAEREDVLRALRVLVQAADGTHEGEPVASAVKIR